MATIGSLSTNDYNSSSFNKSNPLTAVTANVTSINQPTVVSKKDSFESSKHSINLLLLDKLNGNSVSTSAQYLTIQKIINTAKKLTYSSEIKKIVLYMNDRSNDLKKAVIAIRSNLNTNTSEAHQQLYDEFRNDVTQHMRSFDNDFADHIFTVIESSVEKFRNLGLNPTQLEKAEDQLADVLGNEINSIYRELYSDMWKFITSIKEYVPVNLYFNPSDSPLTWKFNPLGLLDS